MRKLCVTTLWESTPEPRLPLAIACQATRQPVPRASAYQWHAASSMDVASLLGHAWVHHPLHIYIRFLFSKREACSFSPTPLEPHRSVKRSDTETVQRALQRTRTSMWCSAARIEPWPASARGRGCDAPSKTASHFEKTLCPPALRPH